MIKTLNDVLSLVALVILTFLSLRIFVGSLVKNNEVNVNSDTSRTEYLKDYLNNEDD